MHLLLLIIYTVILLVLLGYSIRISRKENLCLCSGPQLRKKCKGCNDMFAGVGEFTEDQLNYKGGPKNMEWPYDVMANGYNTGGADCSVGDGVL